MTLIVKQESLKKFSNSFGFSMNLGCLPNKQHVYLALKAKNKTVKLERLSNYGLLKPQVFGDEIMDTRVGGQDQKKVSFFFLNEIHDSFYLSFFCLVS